MRFSAPVVAMIFVSVARSGSVAGAISVVSAKGTEHAAFDGPPVVWLEPAEGQTPVSPRRAVMVQKGKRFTPHELVVEVGSTVNFPNLDPIFHNAFSSFDGQIFDIGLYPPGKSRDIQFRRPGVVRVFCNIHPSMAAVILVLNTPHWAIAGGGGRYSLANVPAGNYVLHVFYEKASADDLAALSRAVSVSAAQVELPNMLIMGKQYLLAPHKNKYGKDYAPGSDETYGLPK